MPVILASKTVILIEILDIDKKGKKKIKVDSNRGAKLDIDSNYNLGLDIDN